MEIIKREGDFKALIAKSYATVKGKKKFAGYTVYFQKSTRNFDRFTIYGIKTKSEAKRQAISTLKKVIAKNS